MCYKDVNYGKKKLPPIENLLHLQKMRVTRWNLWKKVAFYRKFVTFYTTLYYKDVTYGKKVTFYKEFVTFYKKCVTQGCNLLG